MLKEEPAFRCRFLRNDQCCATARGKWNAAIKAVVSAVYDTERMSWPGGGLSRTPQKEAEA